MKKNTMMQTEDEDEEEEDSDVSRVISEKSDHGIIAQHQSRIQTDLSFRHEP
jgi:hypothetical protein